MLTAFAKISGSGNDFILIHDEEEEFPDAPDLIRALCHRQLGIGADGLILLRPGVKMAYYNSDGYPAAMCGNGLRALARFRRHLGFDEESYVITTPVGSHRVEGDAVEIGRPRDMVLNSAVDDWTVHTVNTGVPHAVIFSEEVDFKRLRHHKRFWPEGVNVNAARLLPSGAIKVRTFERGVEAETLACGTGGAAVFAIATKLFHLRGERRILFASGEEVTYRFGEKGEIFMVGEASLIFEGVKEIDYAYWNSQRDQKSRVPHWSHSG